MSAEQIKRATPVCEECWIKKHSKWEPESIDDHGNIKMQLVGINTPDYFSRGSVELCEDCQKITIAGIYEFREPEIIYGDDVGDYSQYTGFSKVREEPEEDEEEDL